jgi:urease beta subunit
VTGRPVLRRVLPALFLAVGLALGVLPAGAAASVEEASVSITVTSVEPRVPGPGGTLRITGTVTNDGSTAVANAAVGLRVTQAPLVSRAELGAVVSQQSTVTDGRLVEQTVQDIALPAEASAPFGVTVPLDDLGFGPFGVYVVTVDVRAGEAADSLARQPIPLPWVPEVKEFRETQLTWVWPVVSTPRRTERGLFIDDTLATELAPGGRLDRIVDAAAAVPVTWVVDPDLLQSVQAMADGYEVITSGAGDADEIETVPGTGAAEAEQWLEELRSASAGDEMVALPYADVDVTGLVEAGLPDQLATAVAQGREVAQEVLDRPLTTDVGWLAAGGTDPAALRALAGLDVDAVLVDGALAPPALPITYTPTGVTDIPLGPGPSGSGASMTGLLSDPVLSALVAEPPGQEALAVQRVLAETAMITAERPGQSRAVLVVPPRRWEPDADLTRAVLAATAEPPWLTSAPLSTLRSVALPGLQRTFPPFADVAAEGPGPALPPSYLLEASELLADARRFTSILAERESAVLRWERFTSRLSSLQWGPRPDQRADVLAAAQDRLDSQQGQVYVVTGNVTFGGRSGTIPVTVVNDLDQAVSVRIALVPRTQRLDVPSAETVTVEPQQKRQVNLAGEAVASGIVLVDAGLRTVDGEPFGDGVLIRVRVTEYGTVGLLVTLGAALVLFGTAGVRLARRARRAAPLSPAADRPAAVRSSTDGNVGNDGRSSDPTYASTQPGPSPDRP